MTPRRTRPLNCIKSFGKRSERNRKREWDEFVAQNVMTNIISGSMISLIPLPKNILHGFNYSNAICFK